MRPAFTLLVLPLLLAAGPTFSWTNPLPPVVRDPQVFVVDGRYYITGTAPPFFEQKGQSPGGPLWSSPDLIHWHDDGIVLALGHAGWCKQRFWAPEIFHSPDDGLTYLFTSGVNGQQVDLPHAKLIGDRVPVLPYGPPNGG